MSELETSRYRALKLDEEVPTMCECCEPARRLLHSRTGPTTVLTYCPTTRAAYLPKVDRRSGRQYLIRGLYSGDVY
jgi:hypothetical protein